MIDLTTLLFADLALHAMSESGSFLHHLANPHYLSFTGDGNPFAYLEKASVVQEARIFNATPIQPRRCCFVLTKILYLIYQGEVFGTKEATSAFFAMTRLFQHKDVCEKACALRIAIHLLLQT
jgi:hypothetical protein